MYDGPAHRQQKSGANLLHQTEEGAVIQSEFRRSVRSKSLEKKQINTNEWTTSSTIDCSSVNVWN